MKTSLTQVSAFVLHSKNYLESSQIIQLFSFELGRFSMIAKGIKGKRSQARKALLQPFSELKIEFTGRSDLKTLVHCETKTDEIDPTKKQTSLLGLQGKALACGYYANELILRACMERQEYPELFQDYRAFIALLKQPTFDLESSVAPIIRDFEIALLSDIGLAPDCLYDTENNVIVANKEYLLIPQHGFMPANICASEEPLAYFCKEDASVYKIKSAQTVKQNESFIGQAILSLASGIHYPEHYKSSQKIMAVFLQEVIGNKPLHSRKLWQDLKLIEN